jgi:hypothetical protein
MAAAGGMWAKPNSGLYKDLRVFLTAVDLKQMQARMGVGKAALKDVLKKRGGAGMYAMIDSAVTRRVQINRWYDGRPQQSLALGQVSARSKKASGIWAETDPLTGRRSVRKDGQIISGAGSKSAREVMRLGREAAHNQNVQISHLSKRAQAKALLSLGTSEHQRLEVIRKRDFGTHSEAHTSMTESLRQQQARAKADPRLYYGSKPFGAQKAEAAQKRGQAFEQNNRSHTQALVKGGQPGVFPTKNGGFTVAGPTKAAIQIRATAQRALDRSREIPRSSTQPMPNPLKSYSAVKSLSMPKETVDANYSGSGVKVVAGARAQSVAAQLMGRQLSSREISALVGAPKGSQVTLRAAVHEGQPALRISAKIPGMSRADYAIRPDSGGRVTLHIEHVEKSRSSAKYSFAKQLDTTLSTARRMGMSKVTLDAAGQYKGRFNGYHAFAMYGFNGKIPSIVSRSMPSQYKGAKTVQKLLSMKGGAEWWKRNGTGTEMEFSLNHGPQLRAFRKVAKIAGFKPTV